MNGFLPEHTAAPGGDLTTEQAEWSRSYDFRGDAPGTSPQGTGLPGAPVVFDTPVSARLSMNRRRDRGEGALFALMVACAIGAAFLVWDTIQGNHTPTPPPAEAAPDAADAQPAEPGEQKRRDDDRFGDPFADPFAA